MFSRFPTLRDIVTETLCFLSMFLCVSTSRSSCGNDMFSINVSLFDHLGKHCCGNNMFSINVSLFDHLRKHCCRNLISYKMFPRSTVGKMRKILTGNNVSTTMFPRCQQAQRTKIQDPTRVTDFFDSYYYILYSSFISGLALDPKRIQSDINQNKQEPSPYLHYI